MRKYSSCSYKTIRKRNFNEYLNLCSESSTITVLSLLFFSQRSLSALFLTFFSSHLSLFLYLLMALASQLGKRRQRSRSLTPTSNADDDSISSPPLSQIRPRKKLRKGLNEVEMAEVDADTDMFNIPTNKGKPGNVKGINNFCI